MTPEAASHLEKARRCLADARKCLGFGFNNDTGRGTYLTAFHAAQAFTFERTGKVFKTHRGIQTAFFRLTKDGTGFSPELRVFLSQAYNLMAVADYETGPDSDIPPERAAAAIETASRFVGCVARLLGEGTHS